MRGIIDDQNPFLSTARNSLCSNAKHFYPSFNLRKVVKELIVH